MLQGLSTTKATLWCVNVHAAFGQHLLQFTIANTVFTIPTDGPQDDIASKVSAFERIYGKSL
ncbi:hypothetical protein DJ58_4319 [Yersinia frederiksenii ATCC 33641]|uniref:Uncharacterized protein n=1 Tax=Yersinia frederiksenii ATCC 33641 TaxID=349966 RepID=A0ABR4VWJ7_YERFR|nr:hypothetical protein DJ58_4319 [Yersinia frederiksenii ATCC 33641]